MKIGTDFSGIGSPEMALKLLGIEHQQVFACEIDKYARKSHRAIYGEDYKLYEDITKRDHSEVEQLDLYVAGFPCQAFSMAGKRKGFEDTRGTLFFNVAEFIKINQPKCFILENVKGLLSHDGGKTFQTIISLLTDNGGTANGQMFIPYFEDGLGYHVYYKVLNTKDYGIPQNRERIFIVGFKEFRKFRFPKPFALELRLKDMLQDNPEYKYFLSDKQLNYLKNSKHEHSVRINNIDDISPTICAKSGGGHEPYISVGNKHLITDKKIKVKSATKKGYEEAEDGDSINFSVPNSKTRRGRVGKGIAQTLDTACNQAVVKQLNPSKESGGKQPYQQNRVYDTDGLSPALNAHLSTGGNMINTYRIRRLTPLECWRLQGYPDAAFMEAQKVNSDTQLYKQAGNSITVNVMMELFKKIYETI
jgi:DNA (cytosine-5)-methyltransferase 1